MNIVIEPSVLKYVVCASGANRAVLDAILRNQQQQSWPLVDESGPTGVYYEPLEVDAERIGIMPDFPSANQLDGLTFDGQMGGIDSAAIQQDFGGNSDTVSATDDDQDVCMRVFCVYVPVCMCMCFAQYEANVLVFRVPFLSFRRRLARRRVWR